LTGFAPAQPLPSGFVQPCLPSKAPHPPIGDVRLHEIKHDGFRVIARGASGRSQKRAERVSRTPDESGGLTTDRLYPREAGRQRPPGLSLKAHF
jgi:hypothetical protein